MAAVFTHPLEMSNFWGCCVTADARKTQRDFHFVLTEVGATAVEKKEQPTLRNAYDINAPEGYKYITK